jgi:hypothetical protein
VGALATRRRRRGGYGHGFCVNSQREKACHARFSGSLRRPKSMHIRSRTYSSPISDIQRGSSPHMARALSSSTTETRIQTVPNLARRLCPDYAGQISRWMGICDSRIETAQSAGTRFWQIEDGRCSIQTDEGTVLARAVGPPLLVVRCRTSETDTMYQCSPLFTVA